MKHFCLLLILLMTGVVNAQETVFKDNLFNHALFSVEVKHGHEGYTLNFEKQDESDSLLLYTWKYETVLKTFHHQFDSVRKDEESRIVLFKPDEIVQEAGRVFFAVEAKIKLATENVTGPIAGTFGFVNKDVVVNQSFKYKDIYRRALRDARKQFRKTDVDTVGQFVDGKRCKIKDLLLDKKREYRRHYLKTNGPRELARASRDSMYILRVYQTQNRESDLRDVEQYIEYRQKLGTERYQGVSPGMLTFLNNEMATDSTKLRNYENRAKELDSLFILEKYKQLILPTKKEYEAIVKKNPNLIIEFGKLRDEQDLNRSSISFMNEKLKESVRKKESLELLLKAYQLLTDSSDAIKTRLKEYQSDYKLNDSASLQKLLHDLSSQSHTRNNLQTQYGSVSMNMSIDSIILEVNKTFIESMAVYGRINPSDSDTREGHFRNRAVTFYNYEPIGIATLTSIDHSLSSTALFARIENDVYELDLKDVIAFYNPRLMNGRSDLSPADTTFTVVKNEGEQVVLLHKTASQKLFEMKVYSDFVGLSGTTPNGLVQLEFSKEMYLSSQKYTRVFRKGFYLNQSLGTYISPFFTMSKLEKNNKFLPVTVGDSSRAVRTLELKRFEMFSVGADMNLYSIAVPRWKTQLFIDPGIAFGRIGLVDSAYTSDSTYLVNQSAVNSFAARLTAKLVFQTDERYFFDMRASMQWYKLLNKDVLQIKETIGEELSKPATIMSKVLFHVGLNAGFSPTSNTNGKLFIRYNYYGLSMKKVLQGFSQIQLGYSYYLNN
ncbi:MAG: hypothetical protein V4604_08105 [Bacteroidota bacterium]